MLPNQDGVWRPGLFVTGTVVVDRSTVPLLVPSSAVLTVDDHPAVFVRTDEGFELRHVEVGRVDRERTEIRDGLEPGETYVSKGAFVLKAELNKKAFAHAGHGH